MITSKTTLATHQDWYNHQYKKNYSFRLCQITQKPYKYC